MHYRERQTESANDNFSLVALPDRSADPGKWSTPSTPKNIARGRASPGRAVDITVLIAALLWQLSFFVLLFVLM